MTAKTLAEILYRVAVQLVILLGAELGKNVEVKTKK
jgi:hypothetical protein